jgi:signal peptidase I
MRTREKALTAAVLGTGAVLLILRFVFFQPFDAPSESMSPTVNEGDYFFVSLRAFSAHDPERGDVVVFSTPKGEFVKRIVGIAGDRIQMVGGRFVLNGKPVARRQIENFTVDDAIAGTLPIRQFVETLPSGRSYRTLDMVDNAPFDNTQMFTVPADHYFVMGDNRDNSDDSRLDMGYIARRDLVGRIAVKFIDGHRHAPSWSSVD